jgi:spore coat polysaccharide biosynthesis predicted glycosyltransferase SpsG
MKIAIIASNNGLGHIKRCSIVANKVCKRNTVHFFCCKKKVKKFKINKKVKIIDFPIDIDYEKFFFDLSWVNRLKKFSMYDLYYSDNLPGIIKLKKKTIIYANFFWHQISKYANKKKINEINNLINTSNAKFVSWNAFGKIDLFKKTFHRKVGMVGNIQKNINYKKRKHVLLSFGTAKNIEKKNIINFLKSRYFLRFTKNFKVFIDELYYKHCLYKNVYIATHNDQMFKKTYIAIIRPGLGIVTDCIKWKIKMLTYVKNQNKEFKMNSKILKKKLIGVQFSSLIKALNYIKTYKNNKDNFSIISRRQKTISLNGEKEIARLINEF